MIDLKDKLKKKEPTVGSWITLAHPAIAEIMAMAGFEWLVVDLEHSVISLREAEDLIRIIELCGVVPLVRLSANDSVQIKRVMDAGAHGIVVPMVNSQKEAESAVAALLYPPAGKRSVGLARAQKYGYGFEEYKKWLEEESIIIAQVEHIQSINHLESILDVPGIDGSIIGPYDLSGSLKFPGEFERQEVQQAITSYESICRRKCKPMGYHIVQPDLEQTERFLKKSYSFLAVGVDFMYLGKGCSEIRKGIQCLI